MRRNFSIDLIKWKNSNPRKPLIIRGARQVGKTWSLKKFAQEEFPAWHYLNFEEEEWISRIFDINLNPQRILDDLRFKLNRNIDPDKDLIIFDEIQRCGRALTSLKYFCEEMPNLAVCAAGSLLGVSLSNESFPVGKVTFLDMHPMNFCEFVEGIGEQTSAELLAEHDPHKPYPEVAHEKLWELWKQYLIVGGLPASVASFAESRTNLFESMQKVRRVQRDLVSAYLADIAKHSGKANTLHIERVWQSIPSQLARAQDNSSPKFKFRDVIPGIRGYERLAGPIDWLEAANLVIKTSIVEKPDIPLSGFASQNRFKLYLFDVGILGALADIPPAVFLQYGFGSYQGWVAENFTAQELRASGIDKQYCWSGKTSEIEFCVQSGAEVIPIEVKSGNKIHSKSLGVFEERFKPSQSYVFSARNSQCAGIRRFIPIYAAGCLSRYF
jgi:predicted AAA+ superfamily ATPase